MAKTKNHNFSHLLIFLGEMCFISSTLNHFSSFLHWYFLFIAAFLQFLLLLVLFFKWYSCICFIICNSSNIQMNFNWRSGLDKIFFFCLRVHLLIRALNYNKMSGRQPLFSRGHFRFPGKDLLSYRTCSTKQQIKSQNFFHFFQLFKKVLFSM